MMLNTKRIFWVLCGTMLNVSFLVGVVHLDGKYSSIQIVGAPAVVVPGGTVVAPSAASVQESGVVFDVQEKARVDRRIKRLEKLVQNLSSTIGQIEYTQQVERIERAKQEEAKRVEGKKSKLSGLVHVANQTLSDVCFGEGPVVLSLEGNARVECAKIPLELHSSDAIVVRGKNNEIVIPTNMECAGAIVFAEENAELTISLSRDAKLILQQAAGALELSPDAVFTCRGAGTLTFASNCGIAFDQRPSGARFVLTNGLQINMTGNVLPCGGIGSLVLDQGARLSLNEDQQCIIGVQPQDHMSVVVCGGAGITMASQTQGGLVFDAGSYDLTVTENGFINVGSGAALCLQNPDKTQSALCKSFVVTRGGRIQISPYGLMVIKKQQDLCDVEIEDRAIRGEGHLSYQGMRSLVRMQPHGAMKRSCSLGGLARVLINKKPTFSWATVFEDEQKQSWVFLPARVGEQQLEQGSYIKLDGNEMLTTENAMARKVCGVVHGDFFEISDSGMSFNISRTRGIFLGTQEASLKSFFADEERGS